MVAPMPTFPSSYAPHMIPAGSVPMNGVPGVAYPSTGLYTQGSFAMGMPPQGAPHMNSYPGQAVRLNAARRTDTLDSLCGAGPQVEYRDRIVEVPEVQIVEKVVEVSQKIQQEKIVQVPKVEVVERIIPVPKPVIQEKIVHVPQVQYREVPIEKVVEVPEVQTQVVVKEVDVPVNVDVPIIQPRQAPVEQEIQRNIPMPVDLTTVQSYEMPKLKPKYKEVPVPIYVPRYIEVPIPAQFAQGMQQCQMNSGLATQLSGMPMGLSQAPTQAMGAASSSYPATMPMPSSQNGSRRCSGFAQQDNVSRNVSGVATSQIGGAASPGASPTSQISGAARQRVIVS